uniref:Uncharacterized protein n=1 Tax=Neobodo designis TaxID=312471 RepID=A0A7S1QPB4_NEODS|mmetsp:Transcript_49558/g.152981  ORF Transcript_49558/g.152981 Transcript_49558/m.152981 type:complete len:182 (+) Transcript_49558:26-571(+)
MGFVNGLNCVLLLVGPWLIANKRFPAPGKAVAVGFFACLLALCLRAGLPLPDAARPWLPLETLALAVLIAAPRAIKRVPVIGNLSAEERRDGAATGIAVGRFVFEFAGPMWAALGMPGFNWDSMAAAVMLAVLLATTHASVAVLSAVRARGDGALAVAAIAAHVVSEAVVTAIVATLQQLA